VELGILRRRACTDTLSEHFIAALHEAAHGAI